MSISLTPAAADRVRISCKPAARASACGSASRRPAAPGLPTWSAMPTKSAPTTSCSTRRASRSSSTAKPALRRRHRDRFRPQGLNEAFKFRNPNIKGECGCGESFTRLTARPGCNFLARAQRAGILRRYVSRLARPGSACAGMRVAPVPPVDAPPEAGHHNTSGPNPHRLQGSVCPSNARFPSSSPMESGRT